MLPQSQWVTMGQLDWVEDKHDVRSRRHLIPSPHRVSVSRTLTLCDSSSFVFHRPSFHQQT